MKTFLITFFACSAACILSCSKPATDPVPPPTPTDTIPTTPIPPTPTVNGLLRKTFSYREGQDSSAIYYTYNADNTLDKIVSTAYTLGTTTSSHAVSYNYYWDSQKRLKTVVTKDQIVTDSIVRNYFYESGTGTKASYTTSLTYYKTGKKYYDSVLLIYDVAGNISRNQIYYSSDWPTMAPVKSDNYTSWQVDANGNTVQTAYYTIFSSAPGIDTLTRQDVFTYDTKKNAYAGHPDNIGTPVTKNNSINTHIRMLKLGVGGYDEYNTIVNYTYDNKDRPVTGTLSVDVSPSQIFTTYYYYYD